MLEINLIRENPEIVRKALADRQMDAAPVEQALTLADLPRVQGWAFVNSLRGWLPARLVAGARQR